MVRMYIMFILAYSVVWIMLLVEYGESAYLEQNVTSIENTLDTLSHNVSELRKDVNISVDVLKLYMNQEATFRNTLQLQLDNLSKNVTKLINQHEQDRHMIQQLQGDRDALREEVTILKHNNSVLQLLYEDDLQQLNILKSAQNNIQQELRQELKHMSLGMVDNMAEIAEVNGSLSRLSFTMQQDIASINNSLSAPLQQGRSDVASINRSLSASLQQDRRDIASINNSLSTSLQQDRSDIASINKSLSASRSDIVSINKSLSASLQQDRSDITSINKSLSTSQRDIASINNTLSAPLQQEVTNLRHQFSSNITLVRSKLVQYIESGK